MFSEPLKGVYIGLGSNVGDPPGNLVMACSLIDRHEAIQIVRRSEVYYTEPVGFTEQPWFANQVIEVLVKNDLGPHGLLAYLLKVEDQMGRQRTIRWGPRVIDLDLLLFGEQVVRGSNLTVPHPRMRERAFVLVPLRELCPGLIFPNGETLVDSLKGLPYHQNGQIIHQHQVPL